MKFMDKAPATYAGVLKSLKVFYRDYLGRGEVVKSFKFPSIPIEPKKIPTKKEVQRFYYALKSSKARALYLVFATSGLRKKELLTTRLENVDFKERMIVPPKRQWGTKNNWVTFFNRETGEALKKYLNEREDKNPKLFPFGKEAYQKLWKDAEKESGVHIRPQILREWFAEELGNLNVPDRYVDAFCGRIPKSVLAKHYTDFEPKKLKAIYERAKLEALA